MRASRPLGLAAALLPLAAPLLHAQSGTVTGAVYDSLARAPLAGAEVQLVPADGGARAFSVMTDAEGRYRVDAVPAGRYLAGFLHPRADSLGVGVAPVVVELRADTARVDLAFPSAAGVRRQLCDAAEVSDSTALLVGFVRDAATGAPRRDATVRLQWTELVIGASGVRSERPEIVVRTRGDGWYGVCGVPRTDRDDIGIVAASGADTSGVVPLRVEAAGVVRRDLYVGRAAAAALRSGEARLSGVVRAAGGRPVAGARVQLLGGPGVATTDRAGAFTLVGQPAGSQLLDVRAIGYVPAQLAVDLRESGAGVPNDVTVTLASTRAYLDTIRVTARRLDPTGFERRRRTYPMGHFLDREAIARRRAFFTSDLFSGVAGVRLDVGEFGRRQVRMRTIGYGTCAPTMYLDRMRLSPSELELFTWPDRLLGVEIYRDAAFAPAEFREPLNACGSIVMWTRPPEPRPRRGARETR